MSDGSSPSIDDLLKNKREKAPAGAGLSSTEQPETPAASPTPEKPLAPESTPEATPSPEAPRTLEEEIVGKEKKKLAETEGPQATSAAVQPATDSDQPSQSAPVISDADLKDIKSLPQEKQVKVLTEMVLTDGLEKALAVTKRLNNPYLYDLLHDTLVDELYQRLKGPKVK
ncbi:hypothetical protein ACFL0Z_00440 [Patescibacteria group bacterium]